MLDFLLKVWSFTRPYRFRLFLGVLAGVLNGLFMPLLIQVVVFVYGTIFPSGRDDVVQMQMRYLPLSVQNWYAAAREAIESHLQTHQWALAVLVAAIPIIMLLRGLTAYLNVYFLQWVSSRAIGDLRTKLFSHLLDLSAGFYTENSSGQLISRVMNDTAALNNILSGATSVIVRDPVTLVGTLSCLLLVQPKLTLISLVVMPLCAIPIIIFSRKVRRASREAQTRSAEATQIMAESFTGHRVVKAYNLEHIVAGEFRETVRKSVSQYMRVIRANELPGPLIEFFGSCGMALVLVYLIVHHPATGPSVMAFIQLILSIFVIYSPIKNLTKLQNQIVQARAASERAFALLETQSTVTEPVHPRPLHAHNADILFDHVSFSYGEKIALHDIQLQIKPGQLVALVGVSGSGKTTLSNLLLRFYDPQQGAVRIGGTDIREFTTSDLRNQMAVVTQETVLFNDTIRRNIELGRLGATLDEIIAAARHAHAHEFIMEKRAGYDTVIGEKGVMLSGGQRQRIAIARAVLRNAPILILDEATNALDTEAERAVQTALDELMQGRTTLCIAHRLSTILHADLIVVLQHGRIVETGTHAELVKQGGIYQKLYELQFR